MQVDAKAAGVRLGVHHETGRAQRAVPVPEHALPLLHRSLLAGLCVRLDGACEPLDAPRPLGVQLAAVVDAPAGLKGGRVGQVGTQEFTVCALAAARWG